MIKTIMLVVLLGSMPVMAQQKGVKLDKGEKKFHDFSHYSSMKAYHLSWDIVHFDVVSYEVTKDLKLRKEGVFNTLFKVGPVSMNKRRKDELIWLSKAILKKSYFWKKELPLWGDYVFYSLRFIEKGDSRFKAIETLQEVKEMLGTIDTEAELLLWITASERWYPVPYSYRKEGTLYRVRFIFDQGCDPYELLRYYNSNGDVVKNRKVNLRHIKECSEVVI